MTEPRICRTPGCGAELPAYAGRGRPPVYCARCAHERDRARRRQYRHRRYHADEEYRAHRREQNRAWLRRKRAGQKEDDC